MMTRASEIARLRAEGHSLAYIGKALGISRQRVWQLIKEHSPHLRLAPSTLISTPEAARQLGVTVDRLRRDISRRGIKPMVRDTVKGPMLWDAEAIQRLKFALSRCWICGAPVGPGRQRYCSEKCRLESMKYRNRPKEVQEAHRARTKRWAIAHPERAREISLRAKKAYQRRRLSGRRYLVAKRNSSIPVGEVVVYVGTPKQAWVTVAKAPLFSIPASCLHILKSE